MTDDSHATGSRAAGRCNHPDCPDGIYDTDIPCDVCGIGNPHATPDRAAKKWRCRLGFHRYRVIGIAMLSLRCEDCGHEEAWG